jgi:hypothetical protein
VNQPPTVSRDFAARPQFALERGPDQAYEAYNEEAFRHFLTIERKRAERSGRSMLLLMVEFNAEPNSETQMDAAVTARLFTALSESVREIDFIGWYRTGRVAAAVLTQGPDAPTPEVSQLVGGRVAQTLAERLPAPIRRRIQVRVMQLQSKAKS